MSIWYQPFDLEDLQRRSPGTLRAHLGIRFTGIGNDHLEATMPVDPRTRQPYGLLHGGASVALAETLVSAASTQCVDQSRFYCVGQEINANHVRSMRQGFLRGTARPFHVGARSQVWEVRMVDEREKLVCISRMTVAVIERAQPDAADPGPRSGATA